MAFRTPVFASVLVTIFTAMLELQAAGGEVPGLLSYQGTLTRYGTNYSGAAALKFALVSGAGTNQVTRWSNDGTSVEGSEPAESVTAPVINGVFTVLLGDTNVVHMNGPLAPDIFETGDVHLRVWVSTGDDPFRQLSPDQRVTAVAYSLVSERLAGSAVVSSSNLGAGAVTGQKLAEESVSSSKIQNGAVGTDHLAPGAVTSDKLGLWAVIPSKIAPLAVRNFHLAPNAVNTTNILDQTISDADISPNAAIAVTKVRGTAGVNWVEVEHVQAVTTSLRSLASLSLDCPGPGFVLVTLTGEAVLLGDSTVVDIGIGTGENGFAGYSRVGRLDGEASQRSIESFSVQRVFSVSQAGPVTYHALAQKEASFALYEANLPRLTLVAVFVPNHY